MEVELAVVSTELTPALRFSHNTMQCPFELIEEIVAQIRLLLLIPERGGFQFLVGFRMANDAH